MASKMRGTIGVALAIVIGGGGVWWWLGHRGHESTDNAYVHGDVTVISPRVSGYVTDLLVEDNQAVSQGDVLMRIDPRDYQARVDEAEATVSAAVASLETFDKRISAQKAAIAEAEANIATASADRTYASKDLGRVSSLMQDEFASRKSHDVAVTAKSKADAALSQARAQVETERRQIAVIEAERAQQLAVIGQAKAKLDLARVDLDNTVIRAPVDGVIGNRNVNRGQLVSVGMRALSVVPLQSVWVEANFKETQIERLVPGQSVSVTVDAFPDTPIVGRIGSLAPASGSEFSLLPPQNATGNFTKIVQRVPVRIELKPDNPLAGRLRPGMSVVADVDTRQQPEKSQSVAQVQ